MAGKVIINDEGDDFIWHGPRPTPKKAKCSMLAHRPHVSEALAGNLAQWNRGPFGEVAYRDEKRAARVLLC